MRIMEGVTSTFKEGLILFYTLVRWLALAQHRSDPYAGFHSGVPLPNRQDVSKHLGLEEDEEPVQRDE